MWRRALGGEAFAQSEAGEDTIRILFFVGEAGWGLEIAAPEVRESSSQRCNDRDDDAEKQRTAQGRGLHSRQ